jgi:hypothetical protein
MSKHFTLCIEEDRFTYARDQAAIAREAALDGIYVLRTNVTRETLSAEDKRADRRSLRRSSTFIPVARIPMLLPSLIRFFDWRRQPHLDQMKHGTIEDPAGHRLEEVGVWKESKRRLDR